MERRKVLLTNSDSELYINFKLFQSFIDEVKTEIDALEYAFFSSMDEYDVNEYFTKVRNDEIVIAFFLEYEDEIFDDNYTLGNLFTVPDEYDEYFIIPTKDGDYICAVTHRQFSVTTYDTFNYEGEKGDR